MIPSSIEQYLRERHLPFEPHVHRRAVAAQRLAAAEHVAGTRVAKVVVVRADGALALAVIAAPQRLDLERMRRALGAQSASLPPEKSFADRFLPCEAGAEPPLSVFGLPIFVDAALAREQRILMRAGTHEDAIEVATDDWLLAERVRIVEGLASASPLAAPPAGPADA
jgi:Ala-tRNA(Pro) deacylase